MSPTDNPIAYENLSQVNAPFREELKEIFSQTLDKGWYILGQNVSAFEEEFAHYCGAQFGIGVASGLDALTLSFLALDLPPKGEVIVPSNTYIASILSIIHAGLTPVLAEPDPITYNLDPKAVLAAITPKTVAILPVHLYGKSCQMDQLMTIAKTHSLRVVEDCAQAHGAMFKGQQVGTFGDCGAFSFYPTKNLGALGDAGAILTSNPAIAKKLKQLRNYGSEKKYYNDIVGVNSRLDELQAAFLRIKLKSLPQFTQHKQELAKHYFEGLTPKLTLPTQHADFTDVFHIFNILTPNRDTLKQALLEQNIGTEIHYPVAPNQQPALAPGFAGKTYPISEKIHAQTLSLPISFSHQKEDILRVINAVNRTLSD